MLISHNAARSGRERFVRGGVTKDRHVRHDRSAVREREKDERVLSLAQCLRYRRDFPSILMLQPMRPRNKFYTTVEFTGG